MALLFTAEEVERRVEGVAAEIATAMPEPFIMVVVVLKGAFIFGADLLRALSRLGWHPPC